jgi:cytochrome c oxidase cbb3-type subunit 3
LLKKEIVEKAVVSGLPKVEVSFLEKMNASVAIEDEKDILLDHNYDGIQELDNNLPPWWKYGFYVTIVFAFVYLINYHVLKSGDLQTAEYNKSMEAAHEAKEAYQKKSANSVTENNVKMITDQHELLEASAIFKENCVVCHGKLGEGGVGPNLTDEYWLHGGSIKDIFTTIKYGWPDKGMKSWQADLTPLKINELASYLKTLVGTNPPNGKAPQGDLYTEKATVSNDSIKTDSAKVPPTLIQEKK